MELMSDPVILATGQSYNRASIVRWLEAGHKTCPSTGTRLRHLELVPNFALRSAIVVRSRLLGAGTLPRGHWGGAHSTCRCAPLAPRSGRKPTAWRSPGASRRSCCPSSSRRAPERLPSLPTRRRAAKCYRHAPATPARRAAAPGARA
jgi:F-box/WD-40 domain protein 7